MGRVLSELNFIGPSTLARLFKGWTNPAMFRLVRFWLCSHIITSETSMVWEYTASAVSVESSWCCYTR